MSAGWQSRRPRRFGGPAATRSFQKMWPARVLCLFLVWNSVNANASQSQPVCSSLIGLSAAKGSQSVFNVYINGEFRPSVSKRTQPVIAPFNGSTVYEVPVCTREEIDEAFAAAKAAQRGWSRTPLWKRAELLKKAATKLREHADEIAEVGHIRISVCVALMQCPDLLVHAGYVE